MLGCTLTIYRMYYSLVTLYILSVLSIHTVLNSTDTRNFMLNHFANLIFFSIFRLSLVTDFKLLNVFRAHAD